MLKRNYVIIACLIILLVATASEFIILRNVLIRHQKLDAISALSFIEARISGYYETLQILSEVSNVPSYLNKLSWLLDELQSQPFLAGVLITEKNRILLNSFPNNRFPEFNVFDHCSKGVELDGIYYICKEIEPVPGKNLFLLVGLETKFTRILLHEGIFYGCIVFFCSGIILLLYGFYVNRLVKKQAELEKKLRASEGLATMGKLAAMLSHEVRNPLNAINIGLQYMSETGKVNPDIVQRLKSEVTRLSELTTELLSLSRGFSISPKKFEINDLLMELKYKFVGRAQEKNATFNVLGPEDLAVVADRRWLIRALENLIQNAFDMLLEGGNVMVEVKKIASEVQFQVADTGSGIDREARERIFEPFFTSKENGLGLGLYIVQKVAEAHGGRVWVNSRASGGTVFVLSIPLGGDTNE